jgi:hypothetical protein
MIASTQRNDGAIPACSSQSGAHQHPERIEYMPGIPHEGLYDWILYNYNVDFIQLINEYIRLTGDTSVRKSLWPYVSRTIQFLAQTVKLDNLLALGEKNVLTDTQYETDNDSNYGWFFSQSTFLTSLIGAYNEGKIMAELESDLEISKLCQECIVKIREILYKDYWNESNGLFVDSPISDKSDPLELRSSMHTHVMAMLNNGLGDVSRETLLLQRAYKQPNIRYPVLGFTKCWAVSAMFEADMSLDALEEIRSYWGFMLKNGATTCWENCDEANWESVIKHLPAPLSMCHGWSAGPNYVLPTYVLGVKPTAPGFSEVLIRPMLGDLTWAEGNIPTPFGELYVYWELNPTNDQIRGWVEVPEGIKGSVDLGRIYSLHSGINRFD